MTLECFAMTSSSCLTRASTLSRCALSALDSDLASLTDSSSFSICASALDIAASHWLTSFSFLTAMCLDLVS